MASHSILGKRCPETAPNDWEQCIIVGHVFLQLPVSVSSRNKQGCAWLALHEVAAKRRPRSGILQLTQSYRRGSENCNPQFLLLPLLSTGGWTRNLLVPRKLCLSAPPDFRNVFVLFLPWRRWPVLAESGSLCCQPICTLCCALLGFGKQVLSPHVDAFASLFPVRSMRLPTFVQSLRGRVTALSSPNSVDLWFVNRRNPPLLRSGGPLAM